MCMVTAGQIQIFSTDDTGLTYSFTRPCEHALLTSCATNAPASFGVFIDSTDGTLTNAFLGIRLGESRVVVDQTLTVTTTIGTGIQVIRGTRMVTLRVPSLGVEAVRTLSDITVSIARDSSLASDCGLCGTRNGVLVLRNGATTTTATDEFITSFQVLPRNTFLMENREECGKQFHIPTKWPIFKPLVGCRGSC